MKKNNLEMERAIYKIFIRGRMADQNSKRYIKLLIAAEKLFGTDPENGDVYKQYSKKCLENQ